MLRRSVSRCSYDEHSNFFWGEVTWCDLVTWPWVNWVWKFLTCAEKIMNTCVKNVPTFLRYLRKKYAGMCAPHLPHGPARVIIHVSSSKRRLGSLLHCGVLLIGRYCYISRSCLGYISEVTNSGAAADSLVYYCCYTLLSYVPTLYLRVFRMWRHRWRHRGPFGSSDFSSITSRQLGVESKKAPLWWHWFPKSTMYYLTR